MNFTLKAGILSVFLWLAESLVHRFVFSEDRFEIIPSEANELWMRIIIIFLVICFGVYADTQTKIIIKKEKQSIFNATISSSQHIINNLLNQLEFFRLEAEETKAFDRETIEILSNVEDLTEENIRNSIILEQHANKS